MADQYGFLEVSATRIVEQIFRIYYWVIDEKDLRVIIPKWTILKDGNERNYNIYFKFK